MSPNIKAKIADQIRSKPAATNQQIRDNLKWLKIRCSDVAEVRAAIGGIITAAAAANRPAPRRAHNISEFRKAHDIPEKIRTKLADMSPGTYVNEEEMRHHCEVAVQNWRRNAELPEFEPHKFKYDGITYWGPTATIKEMKVITGKA
jgi:hypothetical protein